MNIGVFFGIRGRVITTSSACTSGSQGIGYAYEALTQGKQLAMVAGGAEKWSPAQGCGAVAIGVVQPGIARKKGCPVSPEYASGEGGNAKSGS